MLVGLGCACDGEGLAGILGDLGDYYIDAFGNMKETPTADTYQVGDYTYTTQTCGPGQAWDGFQCYNLDVTPPPSVYQQQAAITANVIANAAPPTIVPIVNVATPIAPVIAATPVAQAQQIAVVGTPVAIPANPQTQQQASTTGGTVDTTSVLSQVEASTILGIPTWILALGGIGALAFFMTKGGN